MRQRLIAGAAPALAIQFLGEIYQGLDVLQFAVGDGHRREQNERA
nr:hypothetical protein [uncultured Pseudomonas sp.]